MNRNRWIDQNRLNKTVKKEHIYILDRKQPKQSALWKIKKKKMKKKKIARARKAREPKRMARTCPSDTEEERKSNVERVRQR